MERWEQCEGTFYEVSNEGNVRTIAHTVVRANGWPHPIKQRVLKPATDNKGYLRVGLSIKGKLITKKVHRLVASSFVPNPHNLPQVNHKDANKTNNIASNLEWMTNSQNVQHAYDNGLIKNIYEPVKDKLNFKRGKDNKQSKLNLEKVLLGKKMRLEGLSFQNIANKFGVDKSTIMDAIKGITWKQV